MAKRASSTHSMCFCECDKCIFLLAWPRLCGAFDCTCVFGVVFIAFVILLKFLLALTTSWQRSICRARTRAEPSHVPRGRYHINRQPEFYVFDRCSTWKRYFFAAALIVAALVWRMWRILRRSGPIRFFVRNWTWRKSYRTGACLYLKPFRGCPSPEFQTRAHVWILFLAIIFLRCGWSGVAAPIARRGVGLSLFFCWIIGSSLLFGVCWICRFSFTLRIRRRRKCAARWFFD